MPKKVVFFVEKKKKGLFSKVVKTGQRKTSRSIFNPSIRTRLLKFFLCGIEIVTRVLEFSAFDLIKNMIFYFQN